MKKIIGTTICICFFISNAIVVGAIEQQINVLQTQKNLNNQIFHGENYDLIIITPEEFKEDFEPLKQHKESKGVNTKIVGLNEIFDSIYFPAEGRDEAEIIKYFIKNSKENWDITYVMLVGGKDDMPVRYSHCLNTMSSLKYFDKIKYPFTTTYTSDENKFISDLYYADIYDENGSFCSWDSNNNNVFGEVRTREAIDDVDLYPDVCIGRILCSTTKEVETIVQKIITYENSDYDKQWFKNFIAIGGDTHPYIISELFSHYFIGNCRMALEGEYIGNLASNYLKDFTAKKIYSSGFLRPKYKRLNKENINQAINDGAGFLLFSGHGSPLTFATHPPFNVRMWLPAPSGYTSSDIQNLENNEKLPIAIFNACSCGEFDIIFSPIAWEIVKYEKGGAIASFSATTLAYGPPSTLSAQYGIGYLSLNIFRSYTDDEEILGEIWRDTLEIYLNDENVWSPDGYTQLINNHITVKQWILFGDPSLKIGGYE